MGSVDLRAMGGRIQARRKQLGYTQEQLAGWMDVSIQMVSNLERGNKAIRIDNLVCCRSALTICSPDRARSGTFSPWRSGSPGYRSTTGNSLRSW